MADNKKNGQNNKKIVPPFDITCPYNFVPLNEKVVFPEWSDNIYHDIPFEDGLSGEIKYSITAKSPILISSGKNKEDKEHKENDFKNHNHKEDFLDYESNKSLPIPSLNLFCKDPHGNYFIPGTSLKGALRSLLEILSFSKLSIYDDYTYSYRDLYNDKYKEALRADLIHCGWLKMESDKKWVIEDCGLPGRISQQEIDKHFGTNFKNEFLSSDNKKLDLQQKSAKYKYESFFKKQNSGFTFDLLKCEFIESQKSEKYRKIYNIKDKTDEANSTTTGITGTIVFTGQPGLRKEIPGKNSGKWLEFIFFEKTGRNYDVNEEQIKNFKSAYFNNQPDESEDWGYWKSLSKKNKDFKIPVFFVKSNNKVLHFGLSQLYKLPYKFKISDFIPKEHKNNGELDFAQCLFGFINNSDKNVDEAGLKGRIQFGHAFISKNNSGTKESADINKILSSPKATFFPFYLIQQYNYSKDLLTYDNENAKLAGFKRYPVHLNANIESIAESIENKKLLSRMRPLPTGTVFEGSISFHNLKPVELGALLSALTFNDEEKCFHTLGGGKPFGFGKSKIYIETLNIVNYDELKFESADYKKYILEFNNYIKDKIGKPLKETLQYKELVSMAKEYGENDINIDKFLKYMRLEDFANTRKNKCYLKPYSGIVSDFKNKKTYKCMQK